MAENTSLSYRNQLMYCAFVRNYSAEGSFEALRRDLKRIRELGTDILWLMPIHPLGEKNRKGSLGSPYAIRDYRAVNPEFGSMEDFRRLVEDVHALGMKCIIDVVYNHTSPDSVLAESHPEWFYHRADGSFGNRIGDWTDVIDLDYSNAALWDYQIETLKMWAEIVDGFRCDVAPMVPLAFWQRARQEVETVRPGCFWLSESGEPGFIRYLRSQNLTGLSDGELYTAFDANYDYDIVEDFLAAASDRRALARYAQAVTQQEILYPANYLKLRFLENHDRSRAAQLFADEDRLRCWTALQFFLKGIPLVYNGQEAGAVHRPSLFDKDTVDWRGGVDLTSLIKRLAEIRRHPIFAEGQFELSAADESVLLGTYRRGEERCVGLFPVGGQGTLLKVDAPDGSYTDLLSGRNVEVAFGAVSCGKDPVIFMA